MSRCCIGIDFGGTFTKVGSLDEANRPSPVLQVPTPPGGGGEAIVAAMADGVRQLIVRDQIPREDIACVGIGSPGPLDLEKGIVMDTPNIEGLANYPLRDKVAEALDLPVVLENDANAAAMGEFLCGAGEDCRKMVMFTLGTGVGSGIVYNGRIIHGAHGMGGELGHMVIDPNGRLCGCGQRGCLEQYGSAFFLAKYATQRLVEEGVASSLREVLDEAGEITAKDIHDACLAGDAYAAEVWDELARHLAIGCINVCRIFDPERIVLAGGMTKAGADLVDPINRHWDALDWRLTKRATGLAIAKLGHDAGTVGAAGVAWQMLRSTDDEETM